MPADTTVTIRISGIQPERLLMTLPRRWLPEKCRGPECIWGRLMLAIVVASAGGCASTLAWKEPDHRPDIEVHELPAPPKPQGEREKTPLVPSRAAAGDRQTSDVAPCPSDFGSPKELPQEKLSKESPHPLATWAGKSTTGATKVVPVGGAENSAPVQLHFSKGDTPCSWAKPWGWTRRS